MDNRRALPPEPALDPDPDSDPDPERGTNAWPLSSSELEHIQLSPYPNPTVTQPISFLTLLVTLTSPERQCYLNLTPTQTLIVIRCTGGRCPKRPASLGRPSVAAAAVAAAAAGRPVAAPAGRLRPVPARHCRRRRRRAALTLPAARTLPGGFTCL
jgi:hypothetical protein